MFVFLSRPCDCSCKVISAFLESSDSKVQKLAKKELQPLIDNGILKKQKSSEEAIQ
jgi:pumilio family protein 6